jgi:hypothetical protein
MKTSPSESSCYISRERTTPTLTHPLDRNIAAGGSTLKSEPAPVRAAAIARLFLGLVRSGYFERTPHRDEQTTTSWLTSAIAELDRLWSVREPTEVLDRLDALIFELPELPVAVIQ